jgi:SAM-dependent methyltransferase
LARKNKKKKVAKQAKNNKPKMAEVADRHHLYQESVQDSEFELDFVQDTYKEIRGRKPVTLREDFCGTARTACAWTKRGADKRAWGVDYDTEVLEWGQKHNLRKLKPKQRSRVELIEGDVRTAKTPQVDVCLAFNFSYWIFQKRKELLDYFGAVYRSLNDEGILFLDAYGGSEAHTTQVEKHKLDGFTYLWDQNRFNAVTQEMFCYIHFRFPDKSRMDKAFSYNWRLWGGREIEDVLLDAGFSKVRFYVQQFDKNDEALDEFKETREVFDHDCWIAYIIAEK